MRDSQYAVILVSSASHALKAEDHLKKGGISCKLTPVPRHLSSDCGICLRVLRFDKDEALRILERADLEISGTHDI